METHLARSDDAGATWSAAGVLWEAEPTDNLGGGGERGFTDHEVPNILPVVNPAGEVTWYSARLNLFVPQGGGLKERPLNSFRIEVSRAGSVEDLAHATSATLGSALTSPAWGVDVDLSTLDPEVAHCSLWNEPALHYAGERLYLGLRCLALEDNLTPDLPSSPIVVFATAPVGEVANWSWEYVGSLAGYEDALSLGGDALTQLDFAISRDGSLLALVSPDTWDAQRRQAVHHGLRVLEVESLDPLRLRRHDSGDPVVRAEVTATDLERLGPAASAYDPQSTTGVVFVRRMFGPKTFVLSMHATGIHP